MISSLFHTLLVEPFYNALVLILSHTPGADMGVAIVLLTILVRLVFLPVFSKTIKTQIVMKKLEPELERIKEAHKKEPDVQAREVMALYRANKVSPFSTLLVALIQIPVFLALYYVFLRGGLPNINPALLYSFVHAPATVSVHLLGLFDLTHTRNIVLALLAGISQFAQISFSPLGQPLPKAETPSFKDDFARSYRTQLKYGLPAMIAVFAWTLPAAVAVYWVTNNTVGIAQELFVRRRLERQTLASTGA